MKFKKLGLISFAFVFSIAQATPVLAASKVFVYCSEASPSSFNPQLAADGASYNATRMVYDRLVAFVPGKTEVKAGLAESWKISKNGLSYVFKLRKGVKFHTTPKFKPTRDFNADDVIFSFDRQRLKDHPFHGVGGGNLQKSNHKRHNYWI